MSPLEANTAALEKLTDAISNLTVSFRESLDDLDRRVTVLENAHDPRLFLLVEPSQSPEQ